MAGWFPQTTNGPSILLLALPDPRRAKKDAFLFINSSVNSTELNDLSKLIKHIAIALIPLAEEAIPLL